MTLSDEKNKILNSLSERFFTSIDEIADKTGISKRRVRLLGSSMVEDDKLPIISDNKKAKGAHGLKIAANRDELLQSAGNLRHHADAEYHHAFILSDLARGFKDERLNQAG
ncbi:MAG: hypothetical protein ABF913_04890 [Oenococcus sp.]|uniref:hypothetical protein n=1 Tax=Oenococcus sp. TaxID=1979414 RepID=UPI0039ED2C80